VIARISRSPQNISDACLACLRTGSSLVITKPLPTIADLVDIKLLAPGRISDVMVEFCGNTLLGFSWKKADEAYQYVEDSIL
jgi:hypothetical protein